MSKIRLKYCYRLDKKLEKDENLLERYKTMIIKVAEWIREDKKRLNENLKKLTNEENIIFGIERGYDEKIKWKGK